MYCRYCILFVLILVISVTGCTIHRLDIQQGNIIKDEVVAQLKPGMSKRQVRFIMGTPLIEDPFHPDRWDYVFSMMPGDQREVTEYRHMIVFFQEDKMLKIEEVKP